MSRTVDQINADIRKLEQERAEVMAAECEAVREQVVGGLIFLYQNGQLSDKNVEFYTTRNGTFSPGIFIKKPRV